MKAGGIAMRSSIAATMSTLLFFSVPWAQPQQPNGAFASLEQRAKQASAENRLDEASRLYAKALDIQPSWAEGWWSLGTLEYDQDHFAKAAAAFEKLARLQPSNGTVRAMLGLCQFELGKDEPARKNLVTADKLGIVNDEQLRRVALYHLGLLELRAHQFNDAYEILHQVAKDGIRTKELTTALGNAALLISPEDSTRDDTASLNVIDKAGEAELLSGQSHFAQAKQIYKTLIAENPDFPNLHFAFGRLLLEADQSDEAVEEFHRELKRDPKNVNSMLEIAAVRQEDPTEALKYAEQAVRIAPDRPFAHYLLGILRLSSGDASGAVPELEIAQKAFPNEADIYASLGNAYFRVGRKADAARARAEFRRLDARTAQHQQTNIHAERRQEMLERQLRIEPQSEPGH